MGSKPSALSVPGVAAATFDEAVTDDVALLIVPFGHIPVVVQRLRDWPGRIVVDLANQFAEPNAYRGVADAAPLTGREWVEHHLAGVTPYQGVHRDVRQLHGARPSCTSMATSRSPTPYRLRAVHLGDLRERGALLQPGA